MIAWMRVEPRAVSTDCCVGRTLGAAFVRQNLASESRFARALDTLGYPRRMGANGNSERFLYLLSRGFDGFRPDSGGKVAKTFPRNRLHLALGMSLSFCLRFDLRFRKSGKSSGELGSVMI
jgi:hypothetical protein